MNIIADTSQLNALAAKFSNLSPFFAWLAAFADARLQDSQSAGTDPFGVTWAALKTGAPSFLRDTGNLEASRNFSSSGMSASINYGAFYAEFHQFGTSKMVARPLVPDRMVPSWQAPIEAEAQRLINSIV